ncbi:MAG TPA: sigma-70 family RNA polymerase sigma factor [Verrucomicrobiae bacterium]|nr:sigma-70 family RNA polymerase sigma factor [Verrucomicrobiae bacterium]
MMTTSMISVAAQNDSELVGETLSGNRDAFGQIVSRYQSLICSLAYSATGSLGQSEDLAQETFIVAWKRLSHLRERDKLRAWLCGIARNRINSFLRREGREPNHRAEPIEEIAESYSPEPLPIEHTISKEEEAILWRSLERIPEIYREPLVLFYREHQSIETVAANLDLTEDAVKQRLSRGRKLLQEQVLAFVEGALSRTNPGKAFTISVLAALPALTFSAKAATIGTAAAKGGMAAKTAGAMGLLGIILSPLMILFGNYIPYRMGLAGARNDEERRYIKSHYRKVLSWSFGLSVALTFTLWLIFRGQYAEPIKFLDVVMVWFTSFVVLYLVTIFSFGIVGSRQRREYVAKVLAEEHDGVFPKPAWEFCTKTKFLGLPLVHIRIGDRFDILHKPVKGWIVVAHYAVGGLFAFGAVAVAPFSIGGLAIGLIPLGGLVAGIFPFGGLALGIFAFGGVTIGWQAIGGFALAWKAAAGNFALAHDYAAGGVAHALQANNEIAKQWVEANPYFRWIQIINRHWFWVNFLWMTPLLIQWWLISRKSSAGNRPK